MPDDHRADTATSAWRAVPLPVRMAAAWAAVIGILVAGAIGLVILLAQVGVVVRALVGALFLAASPERSSPPS